VSLDKPDIDLRSAAIGQGREKQKSPKQKTP
jgi:hypothetical protein